MGVVSGFLCFLAALFGVALLASGAGILGLVVVLGCLQADYTGLGMFFGVVFGPVLMMAGAAILAPKALRQFVWDGGKVAVPAVLVAGVCLWVVLLSPTITVWTERQSEIQKVRAQEQEILAAFNDNRYVDFLVVCRIPINLQGEDREAWLLQKKEFARKNIIASLGPGIKKYKIDLWGSDDVFFVASMTKESYDMLKQSGYAASIELFRGQCNIEY